MVEVDPVVLAVAGTIAAGLATIVVCLQRGSKQVESESSIKQPASEKPKKSKKKTTKKPTSSNENSAEDDADAEIAAIMKSVGQIAPQQKVAKKTKEVVKVSGPSASEIAAKAEAIRVAELAEATEAFEAAAEAEAKELIEYMLAAKEAQRLLEEEELKKSKKPKESPEQKTARLERQKLAKVKKVEEEELSKLAAIQLVATESHSVATPSTFNNAGLAHVHVDGWAVVEDKRKVKAKLLPVAPIVVETASGEPATPSAPVDFIKSQVTVDGNKIGAIIGPKGVTLHGIQDATGVSIDTPKGDRDVTKPVIITISGTAAGVAAAILAINDLCSKGYTKLLAGDDFIKTEITVEGKKIGAIVGPKGATLHGIQDATGVEINTPKGDRDNSLPVIITISGTAEGVATATRAINDLCSKGYTKLLAGEDFKEGSMEVHPIFLSEIIGKGGANIRAIQDFTGVRLSIPQVAKNHPLPVKIMIAGNKEKVQQAKDIITELTKFYHTSVTHPGQEHIEMDVPSALYNYIIGSRGSEIKHIQGNFKVSVHIPNNDSISQNVLIVGDAVGVKGAEKYIQKIIDQAVADREAAEKMADSWVETEPEEEGREEWMNEFTHPSSNRAPTDGAAPLEAATGNLSEPFEGGLKSGNASTAAAAASASAWGASVLSSAEGW